MAGILWYNIGLLWYLNILITFKNEKLFMIRHWILFILRISKVYMTWEYKLQVSCTYSSVLLLIIVTSMPE